LFAPELHVGIGAVTLNLDVLYFHGHVVEQNARLLLKMLFDCLLDRGVRWDACRPVAVAQDQCRTGQAQQRGSHDDLTKGGGGWRAR
jgi:hypothetical protein